MKVGIIGHKSAGRSTLFEGLTGQKRSPHGAEKTQLGIAKILDPRVDALSAICNPKKTIYAEIQLALGPAHPTGPLNLPVIREARDPSYAHVIGAFTGEPVEETVIGQIADMAADMVLADMERVETRIKRIKKVGGARPREDDMLKLAIACLEQERPLRLDTWDEQMTGLMDELGLISHRPLLTIANVPEEMAGDSPPPAIEESAGQQGSLLMWLCAPLEAELASVEPGEQEEFLAAYGLEQSVSQRFVATAFSLLDQICFFTIGPDEVRAWPIPKDTNAKRAARTIHSDLEKGFIRAEVVDYDTLVANGSEAKCKELGVLRTEGKDYVVLDGDIINVRFNL